MAKKKVKKKKAAKKRAKNYNAKLAITGTLESVLMASLVKRKN